MARHVYISLPCGGVRGGSPVGAGSALFCISECRDKARLVRVRRWPWITIFWHGIYGTHQEPLPYISPTSHSEQSEESLKALAGVEILHWRSGWHDYLIALLHFETPLQSIYSLPLGAERNRSSACDDCRFIGTKEFLLLGRGLLIGVAPWFLRSPCLKNSHPLAKNYKLNLYL